MGQLLPILPRDVPFVLLDDARCEGAKDARLYHSPCEMVIASRPDEVAPALARMDALSRDGLHLAGHMAYEAGLAMEPRLAKLADVRCGADGPLIWMGAFARYEVIAAADMPMWLSLQMDGAVPSAIGPLEPALSIGAYQAAFSTVHDAIVAGDIYQANLTFPLVGSWSGDPVAIYAGLRQAAGGGYGGLVHDGDAWLLSLSPELFFTMNKGRVTARPMKGTRARGIDAASDAAHLAELEDSTKDRAENLMIVDLMRNDLARVAVAGSVRVDAPFAVETYPTVHQMVTTIRAELLPQYGAKDLLSALFPCGSITGAPKIRAMEILAEVERDSRGAYCGAIGRIDPSTMADGAIGSGEAAFNVAIRTLRLTRIENGDKAPAGRVVMGVGSAITADSDCMAEWRECVVKGGFVRETGGDAEQAAARFDLIETMAFTPDAGVVLLELHLARLTASAAELGFSWDRHAVRNAIQALCFAAEAPAKLRLVLARSGAYALDMADMPQLLTEPARCIVLPLPVDAGDWRLRHKTTDRGFYEAGLRAAKAMGADEALFIRDDGLVSEGCFSNIFVLRDGVYHTPPLALGLLGGVLRASLLDEGRAIEAALRMEDLADGFFIGNALRGLMPAVLI